MGKKFSLIKKFCILSFLLSAFSSNAMSGSTTGQDFTNFAQDLNHPIFPKNGILSIYEEKSDQKVLRQFTGLYVYELGSSDFSSCVKRTEEWVKCHIKGVTGWVKRASFESSEEISPVRDWPFRYWVSIAGDGSGTEENQMLLEATKKSPYLLKPIEFENIFFVVIFDSEGFAINAKTNKKTGDRIFVIDGAIYLARAKSSERMKSGFLFLNYYNAALQAICPGKTADSCRSAVNLSRNWTGISRLNTSPGKEFVYDESRQRREKASPWFGAETVAFARRSDEIIPLLYTVPENVWMKSDQGASDAQRENMRATEFCIVDCNAKHSRIKLEFN